MTAEMDVSNSLRGMAPRAINSARSQPLQSAVQWALLGLVIERPSYGYELATRFERVYGGVLRLSSLSYAYKVLETLQEHQLIELVPGTGSDRQPKPIYRPTPEGVAAFEEHLIAEIAEDRRRSRLSARKLTAFAQDPEAGLALIARIRDACLKEAVQAGLPSPPMDVEPDQAGRLAERLAGEEGRLAIDAKLTWLDYAARELQAHAGRPRGK